MDTQTHTGNTNGNNGNGTHSPQADESASIFSPPPSPIPTQERYQTTRGYTVEFLGVMPLVDRLRFETNKKLPIVPTYTTETANGVVETHPHYYRLVEIDELDADTGVPTGKKTFEAQTSLTTDAQLENLEGDARTKALAERAEWERYKQESAAADRAYAERFTNLVLLHGLRVLNAPADDDTAWAETQELLGIEVPTKALARRLHWLQTELTGSNDEIKHLITRVLAASGTDEEVISEMEASFRHPVGGRAGNAANGIGDTDERQELVSQQTV